MRKEDIRPGLVVTNTADKPPKHCLWLVVAQDKEGWVVFELQAFGVRARRPWAHPKLLGTIAENHIQPF